MYQGAPGLLRWSGKAESQPQHQPSREGRRVQAFRPLSVYSTPDIDPVHQTDPDLTFLKAHGPCAIIPYKEAPCPSKQSA